MQPGAVSTPSPEAADGTGAPPTLGARLRRDFYDRPTRVVAEELIGCTLLHRGVGGVIVESEAYEEDDPACHGFGGRTERNAAIFGPPGHAYVYVCYGIHRMFNVVAEREGVAGAILVRALRPTHGIAEMRARRGVRGEAELCSGPGKIGQALGFTESQSAASLLRGPIAIHARSSDLEPPRIATGPRIGINKAVDLPWRYCEVGSAHLSRPFPI